MAAHVPAKLRTPDLSRFILRASQLETAKPVIAYWCEYWIVNQILTKGLHNGDDETLQYTTTLMDKLEKIKSENSTNDAIVDDAAGQAYVEQFGLETFQRADRAVQADKVTKQTADTFQAAATFLDLVNIWAAPDAETQAKIKYAKWNALRIAKAIKEGKDPNESNPKPEPDPEEILPALDPNDPEVQELEETKPGQPTVEEVPDEQDRIEERLARQSSIDQSLHPSAQVSAQVSARGSPRGGPTPPYEPYPRNGFPYTAVRDDNVSPLEPSPNERNGSAGGGYFPEVPTSTSEVSDSTLPTAPPDLSLPKEPTIPPGSSVSPVNDPMPPPTVVDPATAPQNFYRAAPSIPPPQHPQPNFAGAGPPQPSWGPPPAVFAPPISHHPPPAPHPAPAEINKRQLITDDMAIAKAQKHARWAISALNFEDAETAVRELRDALQTLGAQ